MTSWKESLREIDISTNSPIDDILSEQKMTEDKDVGIINPYNGAGLVIRENQRADFFTDFGLGISIDPETQSLNIFAPNINIVSDNIKTHSHEDHLEFYSKENKRIDELLKEVDDE